MLSFCPSTSSAIPLSAETIDIHLIGSHWSLDLFFTYGAVFSLSQAGKKEPSG